MPANAEYPCTLIYLPKMPGNTTIKIAQQPTTAPLKPPQYICICGRRRFPVASSEFRISVWVFRFSVFGWWWIDCVCMTINSSSCAINSVAFCHINVHTYIRIVSAVVMAYLAQKLATPVNVEQPNSPTT